MSCDAVQAKMRGLETLEGAKCGRCTIPQIFSY